MMSYLFVRTSDVPEEIDNSGYANCCGQKPKVKSWGKRDMISVHCRNTECPNYKKAVLCYEDEAVERWAKFAKEAE